MQSIPVDLEQLVFVAMGSPRAKVRNRQTGEVVMARGQRVTVVPIAALAADEAGGEEDDGAILRVQVLGEVEGIRRGMPVQVAGLVARPYDFKDERSGEHKFGITYWAQSITPIANGGNPSRVAEAAARSDGAPVDRGAA